MSGGDLGAQSFGELVKEGVLFGGLVLQAHHLALALPHRLLALEGKLDELLLADCGARGYAAPQLA